MRIAMIGTGYVGLVSGACLSEFGHHVICVDKDVAKIQALEKGKIPIFEPGLDEVVATNEHGIRMIIGDVRNMHVRVDIDENDIPRAYPYFKPGVPAYASPRGDPSKRFPMRFVRIEPYVIPKKSLTGDNTERVDTRVLQVIYSFKQPVDQNIYVGQQMDVYLDDGDASVATNEREAPAPLADIAAH